MVESGTPYRHLRLPNRGDTLDIYYTRHKRLCRIELCGSWAVSGKGKTPTTEFSIFLSKKNFDGKEELKFERATVQRKLLMKQLIRNLLNTIHSYKLIFKSSNYELP